MRVTLLFTMLVLSHDASPNICCGNKGACCKVEENHNIISVMGPGGEGL
jgi:hypothetical protein